MYCLLHYPPTSQNSRISPHRTNSISSTLPAIPSNMQCTDFPPCTLAFRKKHLLRTHISEIHTHAPAFQCPHVEEGCTFAVNSQSKLNVHLKKRHTKRYSCDECDESFILYLDLQRHKRDDHRPRCYTCDLEFYNRETLNEHLKIHRTTLDERKKFICEYPDCTKRYTKVPPPLTMLMIAIRVEESC
jgi:general transcription factor IIIA